MARIWSGDRNVVVAMGNRGPAQFAQMEAYWQALRPDGRGLPRRADIDPRGIADLLDRTLMLERIAPGQVRIRLAGMALCDLLGMELRGMPFSALMVPGARAALAEELERVFNGPAIARIGLEGEKGMLRPPLSAQLLVLPVLGQAGRADRALACLVTEGRPGRAPRRFTLTAARLHPVGDEAPAAAAPAAAQPAPGMAEAPVGFVPGPRRPWLRLVKG